VESESASETEDGETVSDATQEAESMERIGQIIQDLFHSDTTKASTALDVLDLNLNEDEKKCESLVTAGGCFALVQLMKDSRRPRSSRRVIKLLN
jgi:hypothetical protein